MKGSLAVVGVFSYLDDTVRAIEKIKSTNLEYRVYSPVPSHEIEEVSLPTRSPVRRCTLIGGLTGLCFGFALAILCSLDYPMRVSAKDVVSIPAFVVIGYECTILFGAIATLIGLLHFSRIPDILRKVGYDPRFTEDKYGVVVGCERSSVEDIKSKLLGSGAQEVEVREAL